MSNEELAVLAAKVAEGKATTAELDIYITACECFQKAPQNWTAMDAELVGMQAVALQKFWQSRSGQGKKIKLWSSGLVRATAAAAILLVAGLWLFLSHQASPGLDQENAQSRQDIAPGRNTAILTLADGRNIQLSEQKTALIINASTIKYSDGEELDIDRNKNKGLMHITTPRGGQYKVILPDSSEVWLNAASSLEFPASFAGLKQRNVVLAGEAYFEIFKDKKQAFVVATKKQVIEVFGTHFNVSAYEDEYSKTTLLEGSVRVNDHLLLPGQQAKVETDGAVRVKNVDAIESIAWKNGKFSFEREEIGSILKKVERWYDVEVSYEDDVRSVRLTGSVSRFENVSKLLSMLENTKEVHFKIEGKKIVVSK